MDRPGVAAKADTARSREPRAVRATRRGGRRTPRSSEGSSRVCRTVTSTGPKSNPDESPARGHGIFISMAKLERVGIVFAGGPAPAANAVIAVAASSFRRRGVEVVGILHGYSALERDRPAELRAGEHYRVIEDRDLWGLRNA